MLETISNKDYKILEFIPFVEHVKSLEMFENKLLKDEEKNGWHNLIYQFKDYFIKIIILKDKEKEWICFYKYKEERWNFEQIDFMLYTDSYHEDDSLEYNNVIKYSAHIDDDKFSRLVTSGYTYKDNEYLCGWREKRKIDIEDLSKIITWGMNLTELTSRAEKNYLDFYEAISLKDDEVPKLILGYDKN